jgi:arsenate reductase-like glutaredoxin family protein
MSLVVQIFGTKKCRDTQKALRFFKERGINVQFINLDEKSMSKGELESVTKKVNLEELLETDGKYYKEHGYAHRVFDLFETLLEVPYLIRTPVTRFKSDAAIGVATDKWKQWADSAKNG